MTFTDWLLKEGDSPTLASGYNSTTKETMRRTEMQVVLQALKELEGVIRQRTDHETEN